MPKYVQYKRRPAKGVSNRNKALEWLVEHGEDNAVFYFADDDNTYDSDLFLEVCLIN